MPTRRTLRGSARTPLDGEHDVLICGASFAGLAVARELAGSGARVLVLDRYEIGERQTSACGIPTAWLRELGLMGAHRQTFGRLVVHTPHGTSVLDLPWTFSTFDYPELCRLLWEQTDAVFETAKVHGRSGNTVHTDHGDLSAPLLVDALGWRRVLGRGYQPPNAPLSRGLEVHPWGAGDELEIWIDRRYVPAGYGWSFPASDEVRVGVGSFDPRFNVKDTTVLLAEDVGRDPVRFQGQLDPAQAACRDRGRHFLRRRLRRPLPPADGGGHPHGSVLRHRLRPRAARRGRGGRQPAKAAALVRYGDSRAAHEWKSARCSRPSTWSPACPRGCWPWRCAASGHATSSTGPFKHYLAIAPPEFARPAPPAPGAAAGAGAAALTPTVADQLRARGDRRLVALGGPGAVAYVGVL